MIQDNPFLSESFKHIWLKHFNASNKEILSLDLNHQFQFVSGHHGWSYINVGRTLTKGISYEPKNITLKKTNRPFVIFDIPSYTQIKPDFNLPSIGFLSSKQYPGFYIDLSQFKDIESYLSSQFSKSSRNKIRKYKKRLETSFNIHEQMFIGYITQEQFDKIFATFKELLEKRFADKQIYNNNLDPKEWEFYKDVAYQLILEHKACLYVIYNNTQPISVTLSYLSKDILFDAITVFDIDYSKFHVGSTTILNLLCWCLNHHIKIFDFSKGYFEYKSRWATKSYDFHYHIIYDKTNFKAGLVARFLKHAYDFKHYLRSKQLNEKFHKLTWRMKFKSSDTEENFSHQFCDLSEQNSENITEILDVNSLEFSQLKPIIYDFLYLNEEHIDNIVISNFNISQRTFVISGKKNSALVKYTDFQNQSISN